jgi:hypothetical protein
VLEEAGRRLDATVVSAMFAALDAPPIARMGRPDRGTFQPV